MRGAGLLAVLACAGCGTLTQPGLDAGVDGGGAELDGGADGGLDSGTPGPDAGFCDGGFCPPERITGERIDPWDLAVDGTSVYWLEYGLATNGLDGQVMKQAKGTVCLKRDAGCAVDLNTGAFGRFRVDTMTLASGELCWTEHYANARDVVCQSLTTNRERFVARSQLVATEPVFAGGELLWVNQGTSSAAADGQVMRIAHDAASGTAPTPVALGRPRPTSVAAGPGHLVWAELGADLDAGAVLAVPLDGGARVQLGAGQRAPLSVVSCGDAFLWANYRSDAIVRATSAPGSAAVLVAGQRAPFQVVCDDTHLYWLNAGVSANGADGELWQARLDGSEAVPMVRGIPLAWALAVDDTWVYYIAQGTVTRLEGAIWRIRKRR